ncbi:MAG: META domain-containing protein [Alphaproteobacteria bacterium]|jgi:heat shock protein HslJ|nr:META domain-containing protein [Alphaproteobacteria bacterium]
MKKSILLLLFLFVASCVSLNNNFEGYYWRLVSIEGEDVPTFDNALQSKKNAHIIFQSNDRIAGFSSCNAINARFTREKNVTHFVGVVATKNKCTPTQAKIEQNFIAFLKLSEYMIINGNTLTIYNKNKDIMLIFKKEEIINK